MSAQPAPSPIFNAYARYLEQGWALVPIVSGKGPTHPGWNERHNCWTSPEHIRDDVGVGLAHAYSQTASVDIDDITLASEWFKERGVDLQSLLGADDAVQIVSGNPGHAKLLYRLTTPLASKKIIVDGRTALELRCATSSGKTVQDVLPSLAVHPSTGQYYKWAGRGHWSQLPPLPFNLSLVWQGLLVTDRPAASPPQPVDLTEARSAMFAINPSCDRDTWVEVGMAWHSAGGDYESWDNWSAQSTDKYPGQRETAKQWQSFKPDRAITLATLFHHALAAGWRHPAPDVSELFKAVQVTSPADAVADLRPAPPEIDLSIFPSLLQRRASELSEHIGCDPIVPLFSGLATISGAIDKRTRLELRHRYEVSPILWLMTIGGPGDKKSPGSRPMFSPLHAIEKEDKPRFREAMLQWEAQEAAHAADMKAFKEHSASVEAMMNDAPLQVRDLPPAPAPLRLMVGDITSQKLVRLVADNPRGVLCYLDEMGSWVKKLNDNRSGEDRGCWLQAYEGGRYQMDRVMNGSTEVESLLVSVYGNIQPKLLRANIKGMETDGLLQRFIPGVLRSSLSRKGQPAPAAMFTSEGAWDALIRRIHALPPTTYKLSPEAHTLFDQFQDWFELTRADNRLLNVNDVYLTAFSKLESTVGRVALNLHVVADPLNPCVSDETMQSAIDFIRGYVIPSLEYTYVEISGMFEDSLEKWVMDYIVQIIGTVDSITLSELRRAARRQLEAVPVQQAERLLRDAMIYVEEVGWAAIIEENNKSTRWALNPMVAEAFKEQKLAIVMAKQRAADRRVDIARGATGREVKRRIVKGYDPAWDEQGGV